MDKVKLHPQQRLDLDDARALQTLVYDYVAEAVGGLVGHISGCLSRPHTIAVGPSASNVTYIELSAFSFVTTNNHGTAQASGADNIYRQARTIVVNYDPSDSGQTTQINFETARGQHTLYDGTRTGGKLWARPVYMNTDTASRIRWDSPSSQEAVFSPTTRESQRVQFEFSKGEPNHSAGEARWSAIAYVLIADGNPTTFPLLIPISAWDTDQNEQMLDLWSETTGVSRDNRDSSDLLNSNMFPTEGGQELRMSGIALHLSAIRLQLARLLSLGANDSNVTAQDWYDQPLASLAGLHARVNAIEGQASSALAYCVVQGTRTSASPYYTWQVAPNTLTYGLVDATVRAPVRGNAVTGVSGQSLYPRLNVVNIEIDPSIVTEGYRITSVQCTPCSDVTFISSDTHGDHYNYNRIYCHVNPDVYRQALGGGALSFTRLDIDDSAITNVNELYYGVRVEVLPHIISGTQHDENNFHPPRNPVTESADGDHDHIFNVGETVNFAVIIFGVKP